MSLDVSSQVTVFIATPKEMPVQPQKEMSVQPQIEEQMGKEQVQNKKMSLCEAITACVKTVFCCFCCSSQKKELPVKPPKTPKAPVIKPIERKKAEVPDLNLDDVSFDFHPSRVDEKSSDEGPTIKVDVVTTITITALDSKEREETLKNSQLLQMIAELGKK